ncbi:caspase activity and apoptosis inhibitor 1-like [Rhopilema esculentum]|uniref:caspase activity and apoptosis inhibitor 1-like n=1 Tax=Rhopilema esculentum TaxID=499914 RepID=UPI0031DB654E
MSCPSPDSSTHKSYFKEKNKDSVEITAKEAKTSEPRQLDVIQNHAINSTQDLEVKHRKRSGSKSLKAKFKSKLKKLKLTIYDPILEVAEIENDFVTWSEQITVVNSGGLAEHCHDRKLLGKRIFHLINKKEFKHLMPENLKCYNARDVRDWCLQELCMLSDLSLLAVLEGNDWGAKSEKVKDSEEVASTSIEKANDSSSKEGEGNMHVIEDNILLIEEDKAKNLITKEQNDHEIFEEIVKIPDQNEIDELLNAAEKREDQMEINKLTEKEATGDDLNMLELELRARALKSFIKSQEMKRSKTS